jgi:hypothetical protein
MITTAHHSKCARFRENHRIVDLSQPTLQFHIRDGNKTVCSRVGASRIPADAVPPRFNLVGFSMVRNPLLLREWAAYHLGHAFDHLVLYDDGSRMPVRELIPDLVGGSGGAAAVTVVDWSHMHSHGSRQITAMQVRA